ncbi:MAG: tail fiber protein [Candidatus Eremiobacteraeota bacterium]|nr:tail fiber protein [Candidatus Eremiobacteraeota bacterium]
MNRVIRRVLIAFGLLFAAPSAASAGTCAVAHVFILNEVLTASVLNTNPAGEVACINNIDNLNIGGAGIYASQLIPTSAARATFGGQFGYMFAPNIASQVPLSIMGYTAQTADLLDIFSVGQTTKYFWIDSAGVLHTVAAPQFAGVNVGGALTGATTGSFSGQVYADGASGGIGFGFHGGTAGNGFVLQSHTTSGNPAVYIDALNQTTGGTAKVLNVTRNGLATALFTVDANGAIAATSTVTGTQFNGSGAGLTAATIPRASLVALTANRAVITDGSGNDTVAAGLPVTVADTGTVTNTMLAGSIAQSKLSAFAGVAVGGALTTATTGTFTGAVSVASLAMGGALTGATTGAFSGTITSTMVGNVLNVNNTTTSFESVTLVSTGGNAVFGLESTPAQSLLLGTSPYATVLGSKNATSLQFGTNNNVRATIDSSGNTSLTGPLAITGALTGATTGAFSGAVSVASLAMGGALTGATTITASGLITGNGFTYPGSNAAVNAMTFPNQSATGATSKTTVIASNGAISVAGVAATVLGVADSGNIWTLAQNGTGDLGIAGNAYATTFNVSSRREWKTNIDLLANPLATALSLPVYQWCYNNDSKQRGLHVMEKCAPGQHRHIGPMANDAPTILSGQKHDHIDEGALAGLTLAAVQQLAKQVDALRHDNRVLRDRLALIEAEQHVVQRVMHPVNGMPAVGR